MTSVVLKDRVKETTTTTGTGSVTLAGAVAGFQTFAAIGNGNLTFYTITDNTDWEVGVGMYSSTGPTLERNAVLDSSNSGNRVDWGAGTRDVFVTYPSSAADFLPIPDVFAYASTLLGTGAVGSVIAQPVVDVEYLVIAGGGGAGNAAQWNAGGGAGGYLTGTLTGVNVGTNLTTTVGAGGSRAIQGSSSVFSSISTTGGGRGGEAATGANAPGGNGGSGGGGSANSFPGGNGTSGQGSNGGTGSGSNNGGGGGAGGAGGNAIGATGGAGGAGASSSITGTGVTRAVGGGGDAGGTNGTTNTGNGGNGDGSGGGGGSGGSGIVILKYEDTLTISNPGGGLTFTTSTAVSGYKITTFTAGTGNVQWSL